MRHIWEPGNGTKYELFITPFTGSLFGCSAGGWVVVGPFSDRVRAMVVPKDIAVHWTYVAEKMGLNEIDASCVTVMLGEITGRKVYPAASWLAFEGKRPFAGL